MCFLNLYSICTLLYSLPIRKWKRGGPHSSQPWESPAPGFSSTASLGVCVPCRIYSRHCLKFEYH